MATCLKRYITNGYWSREQLLCLPDCPPARPPAGVGRLGGGGRTPQATSRASELQSRAILLPIKMVAKKRWPPVRAGQQSRISVKKNLKCLSFLTKCLNYHAQNETKDGPMFSSQKGCRVAGGCSGCVAELCRVVVTAINPNELNGSDCFRDLWTKEIIM